MPPINTTPEDFVEKWSRRLKQATPDIEKGVARVTVAPTAEAVKKQSKMLTRLNEAVNSGKWARALSRVSLEQWKTATTEKGIPRISAGVDGATEKTLRFATALLSHEKSLVAKIETMPDLTIEDAVNRAATWIRGMSSFKMS